MNNMRTKPRKKHFTLAAKFIIGFVILCVLICGTSAYIGITQFTNSVMEQYNITAYQVAEVAASFVETDSLQKYANLARGHREGRVSEEELQLYINDPSYRLTRTRLTQLREGMQANDIFLAILDVDEIQNYQGTKEGWNPVIYLFDCYAEAEYSYYLGDSSPFNPEFINEALAAYTEGVKPTNYFVSHSDYGFNTSALLPIKDESGNVIALSGVEIPMTSIDDTVHAFLTTAILFTVLLAALLIVIFMLYLFRRVIQPIRIIAGESSGFIHDRTVSEKLIAINTHDEIQELAHTVHDMQVDINDYISNITQITAEKERIGAELDIARHIQASMLPCLFPAFPDESEYIDIYATMDPAKEVGGDFYDFFMVDEHHVAIVAADVSGKGVPAALFMVIGKTLIKDHTLPGSDLGKVFSKVNNMLCEANSEGLFITAFEGVLDLRNGEFRFVNAGHERPAICTKAAGRYEFQQIRSGFVLAGMEDTPYRAGVMQLNPGDKIFQYTDGVTEATNAESELYGMDRLEAVLNRCTDCSPAETLPIVKEDIDRFVGDAPQFDDITMLCLEFKKFKPET